ncbi:transport and Golgi organization protein 11 [Ischnura elegans]|uniref:transport and Golgi organization protein 11 n=1 Tax=Ischnura elegans TaxID=197161 RepID=UPI001ED86E0F|nr:transport and Golgi organization protein 11 [Ischnura elegans]
MADVTSPSRFNADGDHFYDSNKADDITYSMRVPKRITVAGTAGEVDTFRSDWDQSNGNESLNMHIPDRIIVVGEDKHVGVKEPIREMKLENAVMPPESGMVKIKTPPRSITLDEHYFPPADEVHPSLINRHYGGSDGYYNGYTMHEDQEIVVTPGRPLNKTPRNFRIGVRELTPGPSEGLSVNEEVFHLRRQVAKLHRRVMNIELDNQQRQQRETIVRTIGIAYFVIKTLLWLYRSS